MGSKYFNQKPANKVSFQRQIDKLGLKIEHQKTLIDSVSDNYQRHIEHLANFARHDMKNSVQSMDSILNTLSLEELSEADWISLKVCLENIRTTIDDFSKLAPIDSKDNFKLNDLMTGVELLSRSQLDQNRIDYKFQFPRKSEIVIHQSYHRLIQLLHNLVINSVKALATVIDKKFLLTAEVDDSLCTIEVMDNGVDISDQHQKKIFEYGFSTTGGSGIGLFHAQYSCEQLGGSIELTNFADGLFTKKFTIKFPLSKETTD